MRTFRDALLEAIAPNGPSLKAVAEAANVSYEQLKKLKQGKTQNTNVEDARRIAAYFGKTLEAFIDSPELKEDIELADLLSQLEPSERQFLLNAAKAQIAARDQSHPKSDEGDQ
ncbi:helix-turn-helix domain-containing protein [Sulfitobacter mediterraneus]|uniref:HTH cro/C1-type domain-containing protein n=1 Tax=Sulfitobacter mediterraneus TaxID=83219 RepID=A0A061SR10_9RHOB|nr:helix-turn-helix transcriptional regulator [Sulfitobacter mediterraneus]KAJ03312.1 hypothetical protein PM02_10450 [Sulfitobacter mediterraneus]